MSINYSSAKTISLRAASSIDIRGISYNYEQSIHLVDNNNTLHTQYHTSLSSGRESTARVAVVSRLALVSPSRVLENKRTFANMQ